MSKRFRNRYQVVIPTNPAHGHGYDRRKKRWYLKYEVNGETEIALLDPEIQLEEDALKEKERRFTAMLLAGATRKGGIEAPKVEAKRGISRRDPRHMDFGIQRFKVQKFLYKFIVKERTLFTTYDILEARRFRDEWVKEHQNELEKCSTCGKHPVWSQRKGLVLRLVHKGCTNKVNLKNLDRDVMVKLWNTELKKGSKV